MLTKEQIIKILEDNKENVNRGDWDAVYESMDKYDRGEFSTFLLENGIDPSTMFKTEIPELAFEFCSSLTSINIPNSVIKIDQDAFYCCRSLTSIKIPNSVTELGDWAFYGCRSLITITIPSSVTKIGESAFQDCESLNEIRYDGTAEEWDKIKLGDYWINSCPVIRKKSKITFLK